MTARASAFCPGHITAFFEICDSAAEPLKRGSRGAGLCISLGARSTVSVQEASWQQITVRIDGKESDAPVTKESLASIIGEGKLNIEVDTVLELPMEQGFAMSAAGALSATYALCDAMKIDQRRAFRAVHIAEVNNRTGLGDVAGIYAGGMEIRLEPGMPPNGVVESIDAVSEIVLSVLGPSI
ncbi:MAG: pantothenate kinase, partial [Thermoplasmata archaeon]|nr:pantothenate kinase [Thermoplasmata archaeon]